MRSLNFYLQTLFLLPILVSTCASQTNRKFIDCAPKNYTCGDHSYSISYPFRTPDMANYCGHPKFELNCVKSNSMLAIVIDESQYQVLDIDYSKRVLHLSDIDFEDLLSHHIFANVTIDFDQFTYTSSDTILTVHFDCPPIGLPPNLSFVACVAINSTFHACLGLPDLVRVSVLEMLWRCSSALIPILESVAERLVERLIEFVDAVEKGFELTWTVGDGWCNACQSSGGVCGYNSSVPNAAACFCPDANGTFITKGFGSSVSGGEVRAIGGEGGGGEVDVVVGGLADEVDTEGDEGDAEAGGGLAEVVGQLWVLSTLVPPPKVLPSELDEKP